MSGGSYDYLCHVQGLDDLLTRVPELGQMADRLEGLDEAQFPGAAAAGRMTRELLLMIRLWESHARGTIGLLSGVWKDVEWWDSNDYGPDQVRQGLAELLARASPQPPVLCDSRGPRIGTEGQPRCRRPAGHRGPHRPAPEDGWGVVTW